MPCGVVSLGLITVGFALRRDEKVVQGLRNTLIPGYCGQVGHELVRLSYDCVKSFLRLVCRQWR